MSNHTNTNSMRDESYRNRVQPGMTVHFEAPGAYGIRVPGLERGEIVALAKTHRLDIDDAQMEQHEAGEEFAYPLRLRVDEAYEGIVRSESNAGFRGIEMSVELVDDYGEDQGLFVTGISTGTIIAAG